MYSKKSIFLAITIIVINIPFVFARGFDFRKLNQIESGVKIGEKVLNSSRKDNSNRQKKVKSAEDKIIEEITKNNNPSMVNIGKYYDENPNLNFELIEQGINGHSLNINQRKIFDRIKLLSEVNDEFVWIYVVLSKNVRDILGSGTEVNKIHPKYGTALDMALKIKAEDSVIADSNVVALRKAGGKTSAELKAEEEKKRRIEEERLHKEEEERIRREEAEKQAQIAKAKEEAERKRKQEAEKQAQIAKAKKEAEQKRKIAEQKKRAEEEKRKAKELQLAELSKSNTNSQKEIDSQVLSVINTFKANMKNGSKPSENSSANDKQDVVTIVKTSNEDTNKQAVEATKEDNTKCEDKEERLRREEAEKQTQIAKAKEEERKLKQEAKRPPVKIENPSSKEDKIINLIITSKDSDDITSFLLRYDYPNFKFEPIKKYFETCILDEKIQRNYDLIKIYCGLSEPFLQAIFLGDLINWLPKYGRVDIEKFNEIRTIPIKIWEKHKFESFTTLDFAFAIALNGQFKSSQLDIISHLKSIGVKTTLNISLSKYDVLQGIKYQYYFNNISTNYLFASMDFFVLDFKFNELEEEFEKEFLDSRQKETLNLIKKYYVLKTGYPLILAASCGNVARVKDLIKAGEDVNKASEYGTALDRACNNNIKEILQKAGAKLSSQLKEKTNKTEIKSDKQQFNDLFSEIDNVMMEHLNELRNLNYELDGFKLGSKLEVTSDMKRGDNEFIIEKGDYTISISIIGEGYIWKIVKEYVCDSLREAKKKMVSETDKIEKKYNLGRQEMQTKFVNGHIQYIMNYAPFDTYVTIDEDNLRDLYYVKVSLFDVLLENPFAGVFLKALKKEIERK